MWARYVWIIVVNALFWMKIWFLWFSYIFQTACHTLHFNGVNLIFLIIIPPANKVWGVYRNHLVRPSVCSSVTSIRPSVCLSMNLVSATPPYETLHICSIQPADVHEGIWLLSKILKGETIQLILSRKGGSCTL